MPTSCLGHLRVLSKIYTTIPGVLAQSFNPSTGAAKARRILSLKSAGVTKGYPV